VVAAVVEAVAAAAVAPSNYQGWSTAGRCPARRCESPGCRPASTSSPCIRCRSSWRSCRRYRQRSRSTSPSRRRSQSAARAMSRVQVAQRKNVCADVEETSFFAPPWFGLRVPGGGLLQENRSRNERCARKSYTRRVVRNTNPECAVPAQEYFRRPARVVLCAPRIAGAHRGWVKLRICARYAQPGDSSLNPTDPRARAWHRAQMKI
jgi:hypothetical protein